VTRAPGQSNRTSLLAAVIGQLARAVINIAGIMVLARLIDPATFGQFALLWSVVIFLDNLRSFGWIEAVVQVPDLDEVTQRSLFWRTVVLGFGFALVMALCGPLLEWAYAEPGLSLPAVGLAAFFVVGGFNLQPQARWRRQMRFLELNVALTLAAVVGVSLAMLAAWQGLGLWALVVMHVSREGFLSLLLLWCQRRGPYRWSWHPLPPVFRRYCRDLLVQRILSVHALRLDQFLLGAIAPAATLGLYNRAFTLVEMPTRNLRIALGEVSHASLSHLQAYPERQARYFLRLVQVLGWLWLPIVAIVLTAGHSLIRVALGSDWVDGLPYLHALAWAATGFLFWHACSWLDLAQGATTRSRNWALLQAGIVFGAVGVGACVSPLALAWAYALSGFGLTLLRLHRTFRRLRVHESWGWPRFCPPLAGAFVTGLIFAAAEYWQAWPPLERLALASLLTGSLLAAWILRNPQARAELHTWRELLLRRGGMR